LTSGELAGIAPTACGALSFVGAEFFGADKAARERVIKKEGAIASFDRYCINPEVRTAIVRVVNAAVDTGHPNRLVQKTLVTIFKNALDFNYLNELMQIIQDECEPFYVGIDRLCKDLDLKHHLRLNGVAFSCVNGKVGLSTVVRHVDQAFSKTTVDVLNRYSFAPAISSVIIGQFQEWATFETALSTVSETIERCLKAPNTYMSYKTLAFLRSAYDEEIIDVDFFKNLTLTHCKSLQMIVAGGYEEHQELATKSKEVLLALSETVVEIASFNPDLRKLMKLRKITVSDLSEFDDVVRKIPLMRSEVLATCSFSNENGVRGWMARHRAVLLERSSFRSVLAKAPACAATLADYPAVAALLRSGYDAGIIGESYFLNLPVSTIFAFNTILLSRHPGIKTLLAKDGNTVLLQFGRALLGVLARERKMYPLLERGIITLDILKLIDGVAKTKQLDSRSLNMDCDLGEINAIQAWIEANK